MKFSDMKIAVTQNVGRKVLLAKKHSPHIFFAVGVAGTVGATVLACRATLKLSDNLDQIQAEIQKVKGVKKDADEVKPELYSNDQYQRDLVFAYAKGGVRIAKLYGPAIVVGAVSVGCLTGSHIQLSRRNSALMAAYAAIEQAYAEYRERVRQEVGKEKELDIYHGAKTEIVNKNGKDTEVKIVDPNRFSGYARIFDEFNDNWRHDAELNRMFIQCQQSYANNLLLTRGHILLNEVYDMLGFEHTSPGCIVGWVIGGDGDNHVDFGMFDAYNADFVNGREKSVILDFNVDGVVYDKI